MGQKKHKYKVNLTREERSELGRLTLGGKISGGKLNRVKLLLLADESHESGHKTDQAIAEKLDISPATVERTRRAYVETGLKEALNEKAKKRSSACHQWRNACPDHGVSLFDPTRRLWPVELTVVGG